MCCMDVKVQHGDLGTVKTGPEIGSGGSVDHKRKGAAVLVNAK